MSFKQFEAAEFNHSYLNCLSWSCLRSYWQQIDDAVAKMNALGWKLNDNDAANIARDLDLIGETSESWKSNEKQALEKVFGQDEKYENALSKQLERLQTVLQKLKIKSKRLEYVLGWLDDKQKEICSKYDEEIRIHAIFARGEGR
jgi:hypothetical protein|tara:strand:+ start:7364 stop:7798 length:435 start_codon:yes stop_codon:yes gene_type:complete